MINTLIVAFLILTIIAYVSAEYVYYKSDNYKLLRALDGICTYSAGMVVVLVIIMAFVN